MAAAVVAILMAACTEKAPQNTYTLSGTVEGLADGDTLLLTDANGVTVDTIIVKEGKFSYTGLADTVVRYALNVAKDDFNSLMFLSEPGIITMHVSARPYESTVGGTVANDALQQLMEATNPCYERLHEIESVVYSDTVLSHDAEWALTQRYEQLYNEINNKIKEAAQQNIDNELGYMLVLNFIDESENAPLLRQLIDDMPPQFQQRQAVAELEERLSASEATDEGNRIPDFSMPTPEGENLNIMTEVQKHQITLLDFWASWCGPCRREMPFMKELYADYKDKGLGIVGISLDDDGDSWGEAISDLKIEWPQMSDLEGWDCSAAQLFNVTSIPYVVVVDAQGNILSEGLRGEPLRQFVASKLDQ